MQPGKFAISGLRAGYGRRTVVEAAELTFSARQVTGLTGRSGSGKSTLLATMAGTLPSLTGTMLIDDEPIDWREAKKHVFRTLQNFPLLHWLTASENFELAMRCRNIMRYDQNSAFSRAAATHLKSRRPLHLSGGERARVTLAIAFGVQPFLLLLDEPFAGLDAIVRRELMRNIRSAAHEQHMSVLIVSHSIQDLIETTDRLLIAQTTPEGVSRVITSQSRDADHVISEMVS